MSVSRNGDNGDFDTLNRVLVTNAERNVVTQNDNEAVRENFVQLEPETNEVWAIHSLDFQVDIVHEDQSFAETTDLKVPQLSVVSSSEDFAWGNLGDGDFFTTPVDDDGILAYVFKQPLQAFNDDNTPSSSDGYNAYERVHVEFDRPLLVTEGGDLNVHIRANSTAATADVSGDNQFQFHAGLLAEYERFEVDLAGSLDFDRSIC